MIQQDAVSSDEKQRRIAYRRDFEGRHAEFIGGRVVRPEPTPAGHLRVTGRLTTLLSAYVQVRELGRVGFGKTMVALGRNDYEPDICFFGVEKDAVISPDTLIYPAPDLAVEVLSPSTERRDRGVKFEDYAAHGVKEYWIVDAEAEAVEQYLLDGDAFRLAMKSGTGELASRAVEGFAVPVRAAFDDAANLSALRAVLA